MNIAKWTIAGFITVALVLFFISTAVTFGQQAPDAKPATAPTPDAKASTPRVAVPYPEVDKFHLKSLVYETDALEKQLAEKVKERDAVYAKIWKDSGLSQEQYLLDWNLGQFLPK